MSHNDNPIVLGRKDREQILNNIVKRILKSHFNFAGIDYGGWQADLNRRKLELLDGDVPRFEEGVREWLKGLKSSHTAFYHGQQNRFLPQHTINATVEETLHCGIRRWRLLDVFTEGPADKSGLSEGDVLLALNGAEVRAGELPSFETGRTHELQVWKAGEEKEQAVSVGVPFRKGTKNRPPIVEPKSIAASVDGSTGTLKIPYFSGSIGLDFMRALATEMDRFRNAGVEKLVIDLRGNIGGSLGFAGLASYLCPDLRPIGFSLTPKTLREGYDKDQLPKVVMPNSRFELAVTMSKFLVRDKSVVLLTQGLGPQPFHGNILVKVNQWTNSASEMVASFAQENALATVIGVKTAGNVLGAANVEVGRGYWLRLPVFGWMTWSGRCLEGVGVTPAYTEFSGTPAPVVRFTGAGT